MERQQDKTRTSGDRPFYGCGVGLRQEHYTHVVQHRPEMDWFEIVTENYMDTGGRPLKILEQVRVHYPVAFHGVALSIGSVDPLDSGYLKKLKSLAGRLDPFIISDHLCWSGVQNRSLHDLLPLPFTPEALDHIVNRVEQVQNYLGRQILLENVSSYVTYKHSVMPEWEFHREVAKRSGCGILLDLNNIYVNSKNHGFDPVDFLNGIPGEAVGQFHLGGHTDMGEYLFDTHSKEVPDPVWRLYRDALKRYGATSTLIEWDAEIPAFERLAKEAQKARAILDEYRDQAPAKTLTDTESRVRDPEKSQDTPSLQEVQAWFRSSIQPGEMKRSEELGNFLNRQGNAAGIERTHVYAEGYLARNNESLSEVYEAIKHLLGEASFQRLSVDYARSHPSYSYNLNLIGEKFPEFLQSHPVSKDFPFLPDLAKLEWRAAEAFHAQEKPLWEPQQFAHLSEEDWDHARIVFQDYVAVQASAYPIYDLWESKTTDIKKIKINLVDRPQCVLIGRRGTTVFCRLLDQVQFDFLSQLLAGRSLGEVIEAFSGFEESGLDLGRWLSEWTENGLISTLQLASPNCST